MLSSLQLYCITPISGNHVHTFHTIQPSYLLTYMQPYLSKKLQYNCPKMRGADLVAGPFPKQCIAVLPSTLLCNDSLMSGFHLIGQLFSDDTFIQWKSHSPLYDCCKTWVDRRRLWVVIWFHGGMYLNLDEQLKMLSLLWDLGCLS